MFDLTITTITTALVAILVTLYFVYKRSLASRPGKPTHVPKPSTKEELLRARVKHFQGVKTNARGEENDSKLCKLPLETHSQRADDIDMAGETPIVLQSSTDTFCVLSTQNSEELQDRGREKGNLPEIVLRSQISLGGNLRQSEITPLKTLQELLNWMPGYEEFAISNVLKRPILRDFSKPKTMICHDMKGGYIEDRFVHGYNSDQCFRFNHWNLIDSFCYFSHSFVTIPPPCWTNAAHNHGVKTLGTVITEWNDGATICAEIFQSIEVAGNVAKILVDIAGYYQFDGWLINIENPVAPDKIVNLHQFLAILTDLMHKRIPESEVIWYDSVTKNGELKWQNKLCNDNRMFFDVCDGIFLNYNWSIADLQHSLQMSGRNRQHDVYVGVDVFGRGCYGGGGWNTCKAMEVIRAQNLSAAIFAPGWVMETLEVDKFTENNENFWKLLRTYLYGHCVSSLPFVSTFCQGYGKKIFVCGQEISSSGWTNLSAISIQPSFDNNFYQLGPYDGMEVNCSEFSTDYGFNGGGSFIINGTVKPYAEQTRTVFRFFDTSITLKSSKKYFLSYSFHCSSEKVQVHLLLLFENQPNYLLCTPPKLQETKYSSTKYTIPITQQGNYVEIHPDSDDCISRCTEFSTPTEWKTRNYTFSPAKPGCLLKEIRLACTSGGVIDDNERSNFCVRIGEIRIHNIADLSIKIPRPSNLQCCDVDIRSEDEKRWISFILSWDIVLESGDTLPKCFDIFSRGLCNQEFTSNLSNGCCVQMRDGVSCGVYVGRSYTNSYYVRDLIVPSQCTGGIILTVQAISYAEVRQNQDDTGKILVRW